MGCTAHLVVCPTILLPNMNKIEIFGWQTDQRFDNWSEKFEQLYDNDDETLYVSKEQFHHDEDDGFRFDYKYVVRFVDYSQYTDSDKIGYELLMVVIPKSLHKSQIEELAKQFGEDFDRKRIDLRDVIDNLSASIVFGSGEIDNWDEVDNELLKIAHVFDVMDRFRGFSLDKYVNRIGTTGWDVLAHATRGEDLFQPAFDRYKEEMKEAV